MNTLKIEKLLSEKYGYAPLPLTYRINTGSFSRIIFRNILTQEEEMAHS